ncbi:MAG: hypothetical protein AAGI71_15475 [Bacteroidota bacterium]
MKLKLVTLAGLRRDAQSHLTVNAAVIQKEGAQIDVGESFTVRFQVRNTFEATAEAGAAFFHDIVLHLEATDFAKIEGPSEHRLEQALGNGEEASVEATFTALKAFPVVVGVDLSEPYVKAQLEATFDLARFFRVQSHVTFVAQIEGDGGAPS